VDSLLHASSGGECEQAESWGKDSTKPDLQKPWDKKCVHFKASNLLHSNQKMNTSIGARKWDMAVTDAQECRVALERLSPVGSQV
jgi:hypothetical protein